jgi:hypothetical protein
MTFPPITLIADVWIIALCGGYSWQQGAAPLKIASPPGT